MQKIYIKYKEPINYLIVGIATTIVNFITYFVFRTIGIDLAISNAIAWIVAVTFAYIANRVYVFHSKATSKESIAKEAATFLGARIFSGLVDMILFILLVTMIRT